METTMNIKQQKWFDRKFDFGPNQPPFASIVERLRGTPARLEEKIVNVSREMLAAKPEGAWSAQENAGHLGDLEPLWQGRLQDILSGMKHLREADLTNKKTNEAGHNAKDPVALVRQFRTMREQTIFLLEALHPHELEQSSLHPRLLTPMRIGDLFLFVAEHDDHHLSKITELLNPR